MTGIRSSKRSITLPLGTISEGTTLNRDLIPAILGVLGALRLAKNDRVTLNDLRREFNAAIVAGDEDSDLCELYGQLEALACNYVPAYCRFGAHVDDGADIGVWIDWDAINDADKDGDLARIDGASGLDEILRGDTGIRYALDVNDHGNATLYRRTRGGWYQEWAVV